MFALLHKMCSLHTLTHLYEGLQLLSELFDTKETSLFQHTCSGNIRKQCSLERTVSCLSVCLLYPEGWCLRWWWAARVSDNSEWVQSSLDCDLSGTRRENPACSSKHLKHTRAETSSKMKRQPSSSLKQMGLTCNFTFPSEHVGQHALRLLTDQCAPGNEHNRVQHLVRRFSSSLCRSALMCVGLQVVKQCAFVSVMRDGNDHVCQMLLEDCG